MKKNMMKSPEQKRKLRRLSLNRETILVLNDPALLELARGGADVGDGSQPCSATTSQVSAAGSC